MKSLIKALYIFFSIIILTDLLCGCKESGNETNTTVENIKIHSNDDFVNTVNLYIEGKIESDSIKTLLNDSIDNNFLKNWISDNLNDTTAKKLWIIGRCYDLGIGI